MQRPLVQDGVLAEGLEEEEPVPAGGLRGDLDAVEAASLDRLGDALREGLGAGTVVVDAEALTNLLAVPIHQADGVAPAVGINAHQERVGHRQGSFPRMVVACRREVESLAPDESNSLV